MSASAKPVSGSLPGKLLSELDVVIPGPEEVTGYLERHEDLAEVVSVACRCAREEFGDRAELSLELYHDPEIADEYLTLYVRLPVYEKPLLNRLDDVRSRYRGLLADRSGWLHVTTDYRLAGARHGL